MTRRVIEDDGSAVEWLYRAYRDREECASFHAFLESVQGMQFAYLMNQDEVMGVVCRKEGSIHVGILPHWRGRWATRKILRDGLEWAAKTGALKTSVALDNQRGQRFVEMLGFVKSGFTTKGICYEIESR